MTKLLIPDRPLQVLPKLAEKVGLNEAIVLQQLYWTISERESVREFDGGVPGVRVPLTYWQREFPFWAEATLKRTFASLRDQGLVETKRGRDASLYTLSMQKILDITDQDDLWGDAKRSVYTDQNDPDPSIKTKEKDPEEEHLVAGSDGQLFGLPDEKPGPQSEEPAPIHEDDAVIVGIWEHFVRTCEPTRKEITPSRRRSIAKALKETGDPELLKTAISGLKAWRSKKPGTISLSVVFETRPGGSSLGDQIEWWAQQAGEHGTHVPSVTDDRVVRRQLEVRQMYEQPHLAGVRERGEQALEWLRENAQMDVVQEQDGTLTWVAWTGPAA